ncbi:DNA adenine methylase [Geminocystis sp. GBBB08]|uniref:DNA adenine methylase n=1 Tax=Geminocystis sp. GBBB08 TaxID=2604140 RepID=UPI0027E368BF|nr:DNA adenine methylase [Geminocystis sp. GBBB08]MBL1211270.1 DNA adenine methylase [Geminocystis sp. GBBB08]
MIKSPLRYPGGKSKAIKFIAPLIPNFKEYREPFLGGGSVFIYLKQLYPERTYWINDIYENLFYFWQYCQENLEDLIEQIIAWKQKFQERKLLYKYLIENIEYFNELEKASAFFIFNRITFSGTTESGSYSQKAFAKRFTDSSVDRVKNLSQILNNTCITNNDYQQVLEAEGKEVFLFLDPPYYSAEKSALYGKRGHLHKGFDHEKLASILKQTNHKWLMTYDDSDYIRNLFSWANIQSWNLTYGMRNINGNVNQNGEELFIANYDLSLTESNDSQFQQLELFTHIC